MATKRRGKLLAGFGALVGIWTTAPGCQSILPPAADSLPALVQTTSRPAQVRGGAPEPPPAQGIALVAAFEPVIEPRTELRWSVESDRLQPSHFMAGKNLVGPDGSVEIGPYGSVSVAGLTCEQARRAIEQHLSPHLGRARITVEMEAADQADVQWHAARPAPANRPEPSEASAWRPVRRRLDHATPVVATAHWQDSPPAQIPAPTLAGMSQPPGAFRASVGTEEPPVVGEQLALPRSGAATDPPSVPVSEPHEGAELVGPPSPHGPGGPDGLAPAELSKVPLPTYRIGPPDILLVEAIKVAPGLQFIRGPHLVRPDGTISLGTYGSAFVAGLTVDQARQVILQTIQRTGKKFKEENLNVDVLAYNSQFYYIITDGGGYGQQVTRFPITGNETVLDALSLINGLAPVADKKRIWVARRVPGEGGPDKVLPVDWIGTTQHGWAGTNYQLMPGDRIFVQSEPLRRLDSTLAKILSPVERVFGTLLLGSQTVQSLRGSGTTSGTTR
jgi:polysaccharide export outer membrane protein